MTETAIRNAYPNAMPLCNQEAHPLKQRPGANTPGSASWSTRSMTDNVSDSKESTDKPWQDAEVLRRLHHDACLTQGEIGDRLGVNRKTVGRWMDKLGIEVLRHSDKVKVRCIECGEEMRRSPSWASRGEKTFCSQQCHGEYREKQPDGKVAVECSICGTEMQRYPSRVEKYDRQYCSQECMGAGHSEYNSGENHPRWSRVTVYCESCGSPISVPEEQAEDRRFCSPQCRGDWMATLAGPTHWNYAGGDIEYGEGWNAKKRREVRNRDGNKCQICGMTKQEHYSTYGLNLNVHHIRKARSFDSEKARNALSNLTTLCHSCHIKAEQMTPLLPRGVENGA